MISTRRRRSTPGYAPIYELAADVFIRYSQYEDAGGILAQAEEAEVFSPKLDILKITISREAAQGEQEVRDAYEEARKLEKEIPGKQGSGDG